MKKNLLKIVCLLSFLATGHINAQSWKLSKVDNFESKFVQARNIEIWIPEQYFQDENKRFPVVYMHDGQNVFNPETSTHRIAWEANLTAQKMMNEGKVRPFIIVASWSTDKRYSEYFPEKANDYSNAGDKSTIIKAQHEAGLPEGEELLGDEYLKFLVKELKPFVDNKYRTLSDAKNTSVCGSSMGGLISLYAICEYPNVFGQAACVSTHWPIISDNTNSGPADAFRKYLKAKLPAPLTHRIYFDYGTATLDKSYEVHQKKVDALMSAKGYIQGKNWVTRKFDGAEHNEKAWQARMDVIFSFLYGK